MTSTPLQVLGEHTAPVTQFDLDRETIKRMLTCGHSVYRRDHVWTTRNGADACHPRCADRLEQRGR